MTITSGLSALTSPTSAAPSLAPISASTARAPASPSCASSVTSAPVICAPFARRAPRPSRGGAGPRLAFAPDRDSGRHHLQAAAPRAGALAVRTVHVDDDVPELGGDPLAPR